ncbi:MAG: GNAT family N-acetyltransferase, partial [Hyphomicrobiales bacterium]|nr:GNAT family N-acetyltransferase [Hyphomicrobiales bacterium]
MQKAHGSNPAASEFSLHYFLRPDHRDISDLWLASGGHEGHHIEGTDARRWLFLHLEDLHRAGAQTSCAINRHTGGLAGFVTVHPASGRLDQIVVAQSARGTGVATMLLDEAKRMAPDRIELHVSENNER